MKLNKLVVIGSLFIGLLAGCGHRQDDWQKAQQQNTVAAYQTFIKKYPNSDQAQQAQQHIAQIKAQQRQQAEQQAWQKAQQTNSQTAYQNYLRGHANGPHASQAQQALQKLQRQAAWNRVRSSRNMQALQNFVNRYPHTPQSRQARGEINNLRTQQQAHQEASKNQQKTAAHSGSRQNQSETQGNYRVQLAAFSRQSLAENAQKQISSQFQDLLDNASLTVEKPAGISRYWRLITSSMSRSDAKSLCNSFKQKNQDCLVVKR